ncbi:rhamnulokinase [Microbacterium sp. MEC084]|uniref:rhamnulokinase n=1 Tax=Microbacterium sp. MEC084 TaxID=1963027 RepID=UPI00106F503E|nr:FGGY-family carbohydrate kinase [Microbacterium sp. MEC084]MCD1269918.1 rhamnulokinase [Microbacterium sp. MEC084]
MSTAYLAVDLGSSSLRVMIGILTGGGAGTPTLMIREAGRYPNVPASRPEGLSWDVAALWRDVQHGLRAGVGMAHAAGAELRGIGVDAWGVDYARLPADGTLREFMRHHRDADPHLAARTSAARDVSADYAATGVLDQAINTAHQLRQDAAAGIGATDDTILLTADAFVHLLTGRVGAEPSLASTTALLDRATGDWSPVLAAGLPAQLPPIVPTGCSAGETTAEVTAAIGADRAVPVFAVTAHDTAAAFMAVTDAADQGTGVVSSGSWAVAGVAVAAPILTEDARALGFTQELGAGGDTLLVKNLSGMWLLQQTQREWAEADGEQPGSVETLVRLLADAGRSAYRGRFDPADPALQAPGGLVARLEEACSASGAGRPASRADLVRAIVHSLATAYAETLEQVEQLTGHRLERVRILGGGARNALLCALTAERTGRPVLAGPVEASIRGVLLQVAIAAGDVLDAAAARALAVDDGEGADRLFTPPPSSAARAGIPAAASRPAVPAATTPIGDPA